MRVTDFSVALVVHFHFPLAQLLVRWFRRSFDDWVRFLASQTARNRKHHHYLVSGHVVQIIRQYPKVAPVNVQDRGLAKLCVVL